MAPVVFQFDLADPAVRADPFPTFRWLREHEPAHRNRTGLWLFTRHADVMAVLRDAARFSSDPSHRNADDATGREQRRAMEGTKGQTMLFLDPPDHTRLRALVSRAFTPKVVERLRPRIVTLVDALLARAADAGSMDLIADFAYPLPVAVICEMLGIPEADRAEFHRWSGDATRLLDPITDPEVLERGLVAGAWFVQYFAAFFERRRREPADDLVSELLAVEEAGDRLSLGELTSTCVLLLLAGHETTANLIGNGTLALLRHPDQLTRLRDDPALDRVAVEELLRYDSPVQYDGRTALEDVELAGVTVRAGEAAIVSLGAANRDPAVFDEPDRLDLERADLHHLAFGAGIHYCLGAALARLEGQLAIPRLVRRFPNLSVTVDEPVWREHVVLRGLTTLPVGF